MFEPTLKMLVDLHASEKTRYLSLNPLHMSLDTFFRMGGSRDLKRYAPTTYEELKFRYGRNHDRAPRDI